MHRPRAIAVCALAALLLATLPCAAPAQGFLHWPQSPRATAMGGTGAGLAAGPGAAFHSPAGIAWLDGTQLQVGARLAADGGSFHAFGEGDFDRDAGLAAAPTVFATHAIARNLTGGIAITSPWGIAVDWERPDEFAGRFLTSGTRLSSLDASLTLAWRAGERWGLSIGPDIVYLRLDRDRLAHDPELSALGGEGPIALARAGYDVDGTAIGLVAGAFGTPRPGVSVGASFRAPTEVSLEGLVDFDIVAPEELRAIVRGDRTIGEILDETYVDQSARLDVPLPYVLSLGAAWEPVPSITLAVDAQRIGWGDMEQLDFTPLGPAPADLVSLDWKDVWAWRIGAEVRRPGGLALRLGYAREESPAPRAGVTPLFPDAEREALSGGASFRVRGIELEAAYRLTVLDDREGLALPSTTTAADGVYESTEHDISIAVVRRF
ncbi:MAG TPA: outer membrane protein transport protein [Gemmatimonadota bacterium]|nr:outer membrane protein transport protein [Gemmatimonadota bacterium]